MIAVEGLAIRYGRHLVLEDVSLSVKSREVYALLGRNGAGKSSLIRCLLGHQRPAAGRITLIDGDPWRHRARLMQRVGIVPEDPVLPAGASAKALARFCRPLYNTWDQSRFDEILERFGVPSLLPASRLSKGQRGALLLALALAPGPDLLVLDDPTLGLDALARSQVFDVLITELADRGITVFVTTHDLAGVERLATHVGILRGGHLVVNEASDGIKARWGLPLDEIFRRVVSGGTESEPCAAS